MERAKVEQAIRLLQEALSPSSAESQFDFSPLLPVDAKFQEAHTIAKNLDQ
jgi:hypothetical protein